MGGQSLETIQLENSATISPGATAIYPGMSQRTAWPDGEAAEPRSSEYGGHYGQPQKSESTYHFRIEGPQISLSPTGRP